MRSSSQIQPSYSSKALLKIIKNRQIKGTLIAATSATRVPFAVCYVKLMLYYKALAGYKTIYFKTNITDKIYIKILIFSRFPVSRLIRTYEIIPNEIPSAML